MAADARTARALLVFSSMCGDVRRMAGTGADAVILGARTRFGSICGQMRIVESTGCSPYGASTIAGGRGVRLPSEDELAGAGYQ